TFRAQRAFGLLLLGSDKTLDDGTAAAELSKDLPTGADGKLDVIAEVAAGANYPAVQTTASFTGAPHPANTPLPRAMWAPHAPRARKIPSPRMRNRSRRARRSTSRNASPATAQPARVTAPPLKTLSRLPRA